MVPLLAVILLLATISATSGRSVEYINRNGISIADPLVCLSNVECPITHFCQKNAAGTKSCVPRKRNGAACRSLSECKQESFCSSSRCHPRGKRNNSCFPLREGACLEGLECIPTTQISCSIDYRNGRNPPKSCYSKTGRCRPVTGKRTGTTCTTQGDCDQDDRFYCSPERVCARKLPPGVSCKGSGSVSCYEGRCKYVSPNPRRAGVSGGPVCTKLQGLGQECWSNVDCFLPASLRGGRDQAICNNPRGPAIPGKCAAASKLLRRVGAHCRRKYDLCDVRRGLICAWAPHLKRTVCQQQRDGFGGKRDQFCTLGNKLGACVGSKNAPKECRKKRQIPGDPYDVGSEHFIDSYTRCMLPLRYVPLGSSCREEFHVCSGGSVCMIIPGVANTDVISTPPFGSQPAVYCVNVLKKGASCSTETKFRAQCGTGLRCIAGKCSSSSKNAPVEKVTHATLHASCKSLPCAPGFVCGKTETNCYLVDKTGGAVNCGIERICERPKKMDRT